MSLKFFDLFRYLIYCHCANYQEFAFGSYTRTHPFKKENRLKPLNNYEQFCIALSI